MSAGLGVLRGAALSCPSLLARQYRVQTTTGFIEDLGYLLVFTRTSSHHDLAHSGHKFHDGLAQRPCPRWRTSGHGFPGSGATAMSAAALRPSSVSE